MKNMKNMKNIKNMKSIILLLKGVLLWITSISAFCFIAGGYENLVEEDKWFIANFWGILNIALGYICYKYISYRELYKLSGSMWFEKQIRK